MFFSHCSSLPGLGTILGPSATPEKKGCCASRPGARSGCRHEAVPGLFDDMGKTFGACAASSTRSSSATPSDRFALLGPGAPESLGQRSDQRPAVHLEVVDGANGLEIEPPRVTIDAGVALQVGAEPGCDPMRHTPIDERRDDVISIPRGHRGALHRVDDSADHPLTGIIPVVPEAWRRVQHPHLARRAVRGARPTQDNLATEAVPRDGRWPGPKRREGLLQVQGAGRHGPLSIQLPRAPVMTQVDEGTRGLGHL